MQTASVEAFLYLGESAAIPLDASYYEWQQPLDHRGRPCGKVRAGRWHFASSLLTEAAYQHLLALMLDPYAVVDAHATYGRTDGPGRFVTVWGRGCTVCHVFSHFDSRGSRGQQPGWTLYFTLAAQEMGREAGTGGAFMQPAPRSYDYSGPPAVVTGPVVAGPLRLPRITGRPPFTIKGAGKGRPGLDRVEFVRQLTGQEQGLNRLTVAEFLANRDQYLTLAQRTGQGRDPKGDVAQKMAREKALQDRVSELRRHNNALSRKQAKEQAQQWLDTQAALHEPDQVAGGHAHLVTGVGDARVNSSIGAQWPKRIKGIDEQIRQYATHMSRQEQETTLLHIELPIV